MKESNKESRRWWCRISEKEKKWKLRRGVVVTRDDISLSWEYSSHDRAARWAWGRRVSGGASNQWSSGCSLYVTWVGLNPDHMHLRQRRRHSCALAFCDWARHSSLLYLREFSRVHHRIWHSSPNISRAERWHRECPVFWLSQFLLIYEAWGGLFRVLSGVFSRTQQ